MIPGPFEIQQNPSTLTDAKSGSPTPYPKIANVLCAIGSPQNFIKSLKGQGIELRVVKTKADHDTLQEGNLFESIRTEFPVIVTEKDWVKLRERQDLGGRNILIAGQEIAVRSKGQFQQWIQERLNEVDP